MLKRTTAWTLIAAMFTFGCVLLDTSTNDAEARGRGRGGVGTDGTRSRGGRGSRGPGASWKGGLGRLLRARNSGAGGSDWQVIIEQEERKAQITERRNELMDGDRKSEQEAHLADKRGKAADAAGDSSVVK